MELCLYCGKLLNETPHYGLHPACFMQALGVLSLGEFENWQRKEAASKDAPARPEKPYLSSFFIGNYRKYEAILLGTHYIFKLGSPDCPELAAIEYLCNLIGKALKIPVPEPFALIKGNEGMAFVTKNFTQDIPGHHNLVHLYHYISPGEDQYTVKNILEAIGNQTQSAEDVRIFLEVLIFDALIGNHDRHGRNLALLETANSKRLSPIYDNISALGLESGSLLLADWNPRGKITVSNTSEPTLKDYLMEIKKLGYFDLIKDFLQKLSEPRILKLVDAAFYVSENMRTAFANLLKKRFKELNHAH